jgi:prolipoprotein diacylglyceryltransferase
VSIPLAVIELAFDPVVQVGDVRVRLETLAVALVVFVALVVAAVVAHATPVDPSRPPDAPGDEPGELNHLRADDLLYVAVAAIPGAILGGRIGYWLVHQDFFTANPGAILDPAQGGLQLSLGVVGGVLSAAVVARLLGAPVGRWMHAMVLPLLLALSAGKAALALGGSGQGTLSEAGWATAYLGPGPWGSLAPALPSNPSQLYEGLATAFVLLITMYVMAFDVFRGRNGGAFLLAIALWAGARGLVAFTWRDPPVLGPLNMDQLISIGIAAGALALMALLGGASVVQSRRRGPTTGDGSGGGRGVPATAPVEARRPERAPGEPEWPDPEQRPLF